MKRTHGPLRHFPDDVLRELRLADSCYTFERMLELAKKVIDGMPDEVAMVCGPITSGGFNSVKLNLELFDRAIHLLDGRGEVVFTQLPFEAPMQLVKQNAKYYKGGDHLLRAFYYPIFAEHISILYFLPRWKTSYGTCWEHDRALELGIRRRYLRDDFESLLPHELPYTE